MSAELEHFSGEMLTELENKKLRRIIQDQERVDWFWASFRTWSGWFGAIGLFFFAATVWVRGWMK